MIWPLLAILTLIVLLILTAPLLKGGKYSRGFISFFFLVFLGLSLGTYALIGRPELLVEGALKPMQPPRGPTAEQIQAAQEMTPEEDNPQDEQSWTRLIRARTVLGQEEKLAADKARVKEIFKDDSDAIARILGSDN